MSRHGAPFDSLRFFTKGKFASPCRARNMHPPDLW
jgi:hypothetical protein